MRIIKNGRNLNLIRIKCDKCGCVFEFDKSEAEAVEVSKRKSEMAYDVFTDYMGEKHALPRSEIYHVPAIEYHINCPCCGTGCKSEKFEIEKCKGE